MTEAVQREFYALMVGELIGSGIAREVFAHAHDPTKVFKIESTAKSFQNTAEWLFWQDWRDFEPVARWLAPCVEISASGIVMIQERCEPLPPSYKLPTQLPEFMTDIKRSNFGLYKGRLVAVDYGRTLIQPRVKMRKAHWYD